MVWPMLFPAQRCYPCRKTVTVSHAVVLTAANGTLQGFRHPECVQ